MAVKSWLGAWYLGLLAIAACATASVDKRLPGVSLLRRPQGTPVSEQHDSDSEQSSAAVGTRDAGSCVTSDDCVSSTSGPYCCQIRGQCKWTLRNCAPYSNSTYTQPSAVAQYNYYPSWMHGCSKRPYVIIANAQARGDFLPVDSCATTDISSKPCEAHAASTTTCLAGWSNIPKFTKSAQFQYTPLKIDDSWGIYVVAAGLAPTAQYGFVANGYCQDARDVFTSISSPFQRNVTSFKATCAAGSPTLQLCTDTACGNCNTYAYTVSSWSEVVDDDTMDIPELLDVQDLFSSTDFYLICQSGTGPAPVYVTGTVERVSELQTASNSFVARTWLLVQWYSNSMVTNARYDAESAVKTPKFIMPTAIDASESQGQIVLVKQDAFELFDNKGLGPGHGDQSFYTYWSLWTIESPQYYNFGMQEFPFDNHTLKIAVQSVDLASFVAYHPTQAPYSDSFDEIPTFVFKGIGLTVPQSFYQVLLSENMTAGIASTGSNSYSIIEFSFSIQRQLKPFLEDMAVVALTFLLCLSVFALDLEDSNRITGTITGYLTVVAYSFIINSDMPEAGYLNRMQYMLNVTYIALALLVVYHGAIIRYSKNQVKYKAMKRYKRMLIEGPPNGSSNMKRSRSTGSSSLLMLSTPSTADPDPYAREYYPGSYPSPTVMQPRNLEEQDLFLNPEDHLTVKEKAWVTEYYHKSERSFRCKFYCRVGSCLRFTDLVLGFVFAPVAYIGVTIYYLRYYSSDWTF